MENKKINIAELLKDCPRGMELDCTMYENLYFDYISNSEYSKIYPIHCYTEDDMKAKYPITFTLYGRPSQHDSAKCVIFPKGKTTWEGFHRPFMDGDIVVCTNESCTFTAIFKGMRNYSSFYRYGVMYDNEFRCSVNDWSDFNDSCRLATEKEKSNLFQAIKDNGYYWKADTKTLEKLPQPKFKVGDKIRHKVVNKDDVHEINRVYDYAYGITGFPYTIHMKHQDQYELVSDKFDVTTLKPFESKVLVRDTVKEIWKPDFFGWLYDGNNGPYAYMVIGGIRWKCCIPYEGNEHLLGTTDDCDEYFKNW